MTKTALITGINGMDGSHLADLLLTKPSQKPPASTGRGGYGTGKSAGKGKGKGGGKKKNESLKRIVGDLIEEMNNLKGYK